MQDKPVALVTGANQESVSIRQDLVSHGFTVLVGSRKRTSASKC